MYPSHFQTQNYYLKLNSDQRSDIEKKDIENKIKKIEMREKRGRRSVGRKGKRDKINHGQYKNSNGQKMNSVLTYTKSKHLTRRVKVPRFPNSVSPKWESRNRLPRLRKPGADARKIMYYEGNDHHGNRSMADIIPRCYGARAYFIVQN